MLLVLASASPARLGILRSAGVDPVVRVSGVDEGALLAELGEAPPAEVVTALARAKAAAVAASVTDAVVVGCDSMLQVDGELVGKPGTAAAALARWRGMAGRTGDLLTGHAVLRVSDGAILAAATGTECTLIRFGTPSDSELAAYVGTGEPLQVAGGFTLDGHGGWFVHGVDGDPSSVIGISLPLTRRLLTEVGVPLTAVWNRCPG